MARRMDEPVTLAYALAGYIAAHHSPEFTPTQVQLATELVRVAMDAGELERALEGHEHRAAALLELGDIPRAKTDLAAMAELAQTLRQPAQEWLAGVYPALLALLEGRFGTAEDLISQAREVGERALGWSAAVTYRLQMYVLRREQGRLVELEDLVRRSLEEYPTYLIWRCVLAQMTSELGYTAEANDVFEALYADGFANLPFDEEWLVSLGLLAETAKTLGDADRASVLYELLLPYGDRVAVAYPEVSTGAVSRYLGMLAETMERWDDAARHFRDAIVTNERIGARSWLAHAQHDLAATLIGHGKSADREHATALLAEALRTYRELGMQSYAASASALEDEARAQQSGLG